MDLESALAAARSGDAAARERLLGLTHPLALRWARQTVADASSAEDIAQEALFEVWRTLDGLREPGAYLGWVRLIVAKHGDRVRRRLRPTEVLDLVLGLASPDIGPASSAVRTDENAIVRRALALARDGDRRLLELKYSAGWSHNELAELLGLTPGAVRKRLHDARQRLRPELAPHFELPDHTRRSTMTNSLGSVTDVAAGSLSLTTAVLDLTPLPTGVRVLDALLPWPRAGLIDLSGPVGTGGLVLLGEVLNSLHRRHPTALVGACSPRPAADGSFARLHKIVQDPAGQPERSAVFRGDPEPALAAAVDSAGALARQGTTVLLVVDRGVAEGVGLDVLAQLPQGLAHGSVTVIRVAPWARDAEPLPLWPAAHTRIVLGVEQASLGQYPAVDLLASSSSLADPELLAAARRPLETVAKLQSWISQPFATSTEWTGVEGVTCTPHEAVTTLRAALVPDSNVGQCT